MQASLFLKASPRKHAVKFWSFVGSTYGSTKRVHPLVCDFINRLQPHVTEAIYDHHVIITASRARASVPPVLMPAWMRQQAKAGPIEIAINKTTCASVFRNLTLALASKSFKKMTLHLIVNNVPSMLACEELVKTVEMAHTCSAVYTVLRVEPMSPRAWRNLHAPEESMYADTNIHSDTDNTICNVDAVKKCVGIVDETRAVLQHIEDLNFVKGTKRLHATIADKCEEVVKGILKLNNLGVVRVEKHPHYSYSMPPDAPKNTREGGEISLLEACDCNDAIRVLKATSPKNVKWVVSDPAKLSELASALESLPIEPTEFELVWHPIHTTRTMSHPRIWSLVTVLRIDEYCDMDDVGDVEAALCQCLKLEKVIWYTGVRFKIRLRRAFCVEMATRHSDARAKACTIWCAIVH